MAFLEPNSVGKTDVYGSLTMMAAACDAKECKDGDKYRFPERLLPALGSAIVRMSKWVRSATGPFSGGIYTIHQEMVEDPRIGQIGKRPRIDLEQVKGTNFRKP